MQPTGEMPALVVSAAIIAQYSVAFAILVNAVGFVIATSYYSRSGVHPAAVPLKIIWGAGLSFFILTSFFFHVGYVGGRAMFFRGDATPGESWYLLLSAILLVMLSGFAFVRAGAVFFLFPVTILGGLVRVGWISVPPLPNVTPEAFSVPLPAYILVLSIAPVVMYAYFVYPVLVRAFGGAAFQPVIVTLHEAYGQALPVGKHVYEVFTTGDSIYFAVETTRLEDGSSRAGWYRPRLRIESRRYLQLPRSAVISIEYTDPKLPAPPISAPEPREPSPTSQSNATPPSSAGGHSPGEPVPPPSPHPS